MKQQQLRTNLSLLYLQQLPYLNYMRHRFICSIMLQIILPSLPASLYGGLKASQMSELQGREEAATKIEIIHGGQFTVKLSVKTGSEVQTQCRQVISVIYMCEDMKLYLLKRGEDRKLVLSWLNIAKSFFFFV